MLIIWRFIINLTCLFYFILTYSPDIRLVRIWQNIDFKYKKNGRVISIFLFEILKIEIWFHYGTYGLLLVGNSPQSRHWFHNTSKFLSWTYEKGQRRKTKVRSKLWSKNLICASWVQKIPNSSSQTMVGLESRPFRRHFLFQSGQVLWAVPSGCCDCSEGARSYFHEGWLCARRIPRDRLQPLRRLASVEGLQGCSRRADGKARWNDGADKRNQAGQDCQEGNLSSYYAWYEDLQLAW